MKYRFRIVLFAELGTIILDEDLPDISKKVVKSSLLKIIIIVIIIWTISLPSQTDKSILDMYFVLNLKPSLIAYKLW